MKKLLAFIITISLFSCSKDPVATDDELLGTWVLNNVAGACALIPIDAPADNIGCIDNPALEVNCSIIEFKGDGILSYSYSLIKGEGTYTIDSEGLTICTDRCLTYTKDGNDINLQTGTLSVCDPIYTFRKVTSTLDQLIEENTVRKIKTLRLNGKNSRTYTYNADGSVQIVQFFDGDGNLDFTYAYSYTPISVSFTRSDASNGSSTRYDYYNEAPDRKRRDIYNQEGDLLSYKLYFYESSEECSFTRTERYNDNQLQQLENISFTDDNCSSQITSFLEGQLLYNTTIQKDSNPAWFTSALNPLFPTSSSNNTTSYIRTNSSGEVSTSASYTESFTYGDGGYPTSSIRTYQNGDIRVYTYEYE